MTDLAPHSSLADDVVASHIATLILTRPDIMARARLYATMRQIVRSGARDAPVVALPQRAVAAGAIHHLTKER